MDSPALRLPVLVFLRARVRRLALRPLGFAALCHGPLFQHHTRLVCCRKVVLSPLFAFCGTAFNFCRLCCCPNCVSLNLFAVWCSIMFCCVMFSISLGLGLLLSAVIWFRDLCVRFVAYCVHFCRLGVVRSSALPRHDANAERPLSASESVTKVMRTARVMYALACWFLFLFHYIILIFSFISFQVWGSPAHKPSLVTQ